MMPNSSSVDPGQKVLPSLYILKVSILSANWEKITQEYCQAITQKINDFYFIGTPIGRINAQPDPKPLSVEPGDIRPARIINCQPLCGQVTTDLI